MCEASCHLACASPGAGTQSHSMECAAELCEYHHPVERGQAPLSWALYLDQQIARWKTRTAWTCQRASRAESRLEVDFCASGKREGIQRVAWPSTLDRNRTVVWARRIVTFPGRVRGLFNFLEEDWKPFCDLQVPNLTFYY